MENIKTEISDSFFSPFIRFSATVFLACVFRYKSASLNTYDANDILVRPDYTYFVPAQQNNNYSLLVHVVFEKQLRLHNGQARKLLLFLLFLFAVFGGFFSSSSVRALVLVFIECGNELKSSE